LTHGNKFFSTKNKINKRLKIKKNKKPKVDMCHIKILTHGKKNFAKKKDQYTMRH